MSEEGNKATIRRWVEEAINGGNADVANEIFAEDYIFHNIIGSDFHGPEGMRMMIISQNRENLPYHMTIDDMIAEGDKVAWRFTMRGIHKGTIFGAAPTGKQIILTGMFLSRFKNDKLVEEWVETNVLRLLQQVGFLPDISKITKGGFRP